MWTLLRWLNLAVILMMVVPPSALAIEATRLQSLDWVLSEEVIDPSARMSRRAPQFASGLTIVGLMVDRDSDGPSPPTLSARLLLPSDARELNGKRVCITARSHNAHMSIRGEVRLGNLVGSQMPPVRFAAKVKPQTATFLERLPPSELAMLAVLGGCDEVVSPRQMPTLLLIDTAIDGPVAPQIKLLLNSQLPRTTLRYLAGKTAVAAEVKCAPGQEGIAGGAYNTLCRLPRPQTDRTEVEVIRFMPGLEPDSDKAVWLLPSR